MAEQIVGYCPKCHKKLQIPDELERFACMYCGQMMDRGQLLSELPQEVPDVDVEREFAFVQSKILACVTDWPESYKRVNKADFEEYSNSYLQACRPVFEHLELCAKAQPKQAEEWGRRAAEELMAQLETWFSNQKGWSRPGKRRELIDSAKFTIALFLIPMLSRFPLTTAKPFAYTLRTLWIERYPKSVFGLATYQELREGFRKRLFCFITTAVCQAEGLPDDCEQLQAFRAFRDEWLQKQPDGPALIATYYKIAPAIVMCIDYFDDSKERYAQIRRRYLQPCYEALQAGKMELCKRRYMKMMCKLQKRYLPKGEVESGDWRFQPEDYLWRFR